MTMPFKRTPGTPLPARTVHSKTPTLLHVEKLEDRTVPASLKSYSLAESWGVLAEPVVVVNQPTPVTVAVPSGRRSIVPGTVATTPTRTTIPATSTIYPAFDLHLEGDFNGDGLGDTAGLTSAGQWHVGLSEIDHFRSETWGKPWADSQYWVGFFAGDVNGDGRTDVLGLHQSGVWIVGISTGKSFVSRTFASGWKPSADGFRFLNVGDFNGDGRTDIVAFDAQGNWRVGLSTGQRFLTRTFASGWAADDALWKTYQVGDFNNDGLDDVALFHLSGDWWVGLSDGGSFTARVFATGWNTAEQWTDAIVGDLNGDHRQDVAMLHHTGVWFVGLSTGAKFEIYRWADSWGKSSNWSHIQVADFNADGMDDIMAYQTTTGQWWIMFSTGTEGSFKRLSYAVVPTSKSPIAMKPQDYNGDGLADVAFQTSDGKAYVGLSSTVGSLYFGVTSTETFHVIAPWDLESIRENPASIVEIFDRYKKTFRKILGPQFANLNESGLAYAFAATAAYQLASYRGVGDPDGNFKQPIPFSLRSLLNVPKLVCNEYIFLANLLFRKMVPVGSTNDITPIMIGFRSEEFGSHTQVFLEGAGQSILIDPTLGMFVPVSASTIEGGTPVSASLIRELSTREETSSYLQKALTAFREKVLTAMKKGLYDNAELLYRENVDRYLASIPRVLWPNPPAE